MNRKILEDCTIFLSFLLTRIRVIICILLLLTIQFFTRDNHASASQPAQQQLVITGKVLDATTNESLPGVGVKITQTSSGTLTDVNGNFQIVVPGEDAVLEFAFMGYISQKTVVGKSRKIEIRLATDEKKLEEIVIVGYGTQKKESVTAAISTIDNGELMKMPVANLTQALTGKIPGLTTVQNSGEPGYDDAQMYIRGQGTFTGATSPLFIVDGVERTFSRIDPNDVESISVLKDASATAVYGVRGANGVIIINTKRGKEGKPKITFAANYGFQVPTRLPKYLDSYNSVVLLEEALKNDGLPSMYAASDIANFRRSVNGLLPYDSTLLFPNVDWYKEALNKIAPETQISVNATGGTKRMRYFVSGTYFDQQGLYKKTNTYDYGNSANVRFRRYSFRANMDFDITKDFLVTVNFGTRFEVRNTPSVAQDEVFYNLNRTPGWMFPVKWTNGTYGGNAFANRNIIARLQQGGFAIVNGVVNENSFILSHKLNFITKGLLVKAMISYDNQFNYTRNFTRNFATYEYNRTTGDYIKYGEDTPLALTTDKQENIKHFNTEFSFSYSRTFSDDHEVGGLLLYTQNNYSYMNLTPFLYQGLVGRATYNYLKKYFAEVNFGYNGSENFAPSKRFGFFPAFSAGWLISNEHFVRDNYTFVDMLKIRGSYGEVGNDKTNSDILKSDRFLYVSSWVNGGGYRFGDNVYPGIYEGRWPNMDVTWERARKYNLGLESLFKNSLIGVNFDVFYEKRNNILTDPLSVPDVLGVTLPKENIGKTKNQGFELEIKHRYQISKDLSYYVNLNYAYAHNTILYRGEPVNMPSYQKTEGTSIGQYYAYNIDKYFESQQEIANSPKQTLGPVQPGDFKYRDMNGDGLIDARDIAIVGKSNVPETNYGINFGGSWKQFDISILFQGVTNVSKIYNAEAILEFLNGGKVMEHHLGRWNPNLPADENMKSASYPLLHYSKGQNNQQPNTFYIKDGSFIRLKNVEIAYNIPKALSQKLKISNIRLFANGSNLYTWDHIKIRDPENSGDGKVYPVMSFYNFGVNVQF